MRKFLALMALGVAGSGAAAHSWYPKECCHDSDCFRADAVEVGRDGGVVVSVSDERIWVPADFPRQASPDGDVHICFERSDLGLRPLCFFVPMDAGIGSGRVAAHGAPRTLSDKGCILENAGSMPDNCGYGDSMGNGPGNPGSEGGGQP